MTKTDYEIASELFEMWKIRNEGIDPQDSPLGLELMQKRNAALDAQMAAEREGMA